MLFLVGLPLAIGLWINARRQVLAGLAERAERLERSRTAGLPVRRTDHGTPQPVPAAAQHTAYRVVQEALTNVHKHAAGAATEVAVRYGPADLELTVHNGPPPSGGPPRRLPGSGLGLAGLSERLELLGRRFGAGPYPDGGFTVVARVPTARGPA